MKALIRCTLRLSKAEMDAIMDNEEDFFEAWGQVKYYLETADFVKFS